MLHCFVISWRTPNMLLSVSVLFRSNLYDAFNAMMINWPCCLNGNAVYWEIGSLKLNTFPNTSAPRDRKALEFVSGDAPLQTQQWPKEATQAFRFFSCLRDRSTSYYNLDLSVRPSIRLFHISSAVCGPITTKLGSLTMMTLWNSRCRNFAKFSCREISLFYSSKINPVVSSKFSRGWVATVDNQMLIVWIIFFDYIKSWQWKSACKILSFNPFHRRERL